MPYEVDRYSAQSSTPCLSSCSVVEVDIHLLPAEAAEFLQQADKLLFIIRIIQMKSRYFWDEVMSVNDIGHILMIA